MNACDAAGEIAVRPLVFGDAVLIEAIEIVAAVEELQALTKSPDRCPLCQERWERLDGWLVKRHLATARLYEPVLVRAAGCFNPKA